MPWLIFGGAVIIATIAIGTLVSVGIFRDRAIANSRRELENTVMLLTRHYDQQFGELSRIQKSVHAHLWSNGIFSPNRIRSR